MKIVFLGSGKFAVATLASMEAHGHDVSLVVTQPDREKGRHLKLSQTPIKEYALKNDLKVFQPNDVNKPESLEILKNQKADIFVVIAFGEILKKEILIQSKKLPLNIHASLLPKYRGAAPINRALMNGERRTGVTFIKMNEYMDKGDIIFQKAIDIDASDNYVSLEDKLSRLSAENINQILGDIDKNTFSLNKQDETLATYAPLMKKQDGMIQWDSQAQKILDNFRGCFGWPGSFTYFNGKILKVLELDITDHTHKASPGEIITAEKGILEVACGQGTVLIKEAQLESHKKMSTKNFLAGHKVNTGDKLGK